MDAGGIYVTRGRIIGAQGRLGSGSFEEYTTSGDGRGILRGSADTESWDGEAEMEAGMEVALTLEEITTFFDFGLIESTLCEVCCGGCCALRLWLLGEREGVLVPGSEGKSD